MYDSKKNSNEKFFITSAAAEFFDQSRSSAELEKMSRIFAGLTPREDSGFYELKGITRENKKSARDAIDAHNAYVESTTDDDGPRLKIYSHASLEVFTKDFDTSGVDDQKQRAKAMMKGLLSAGIFRKLQTIPPDFRQKLNALSIKFPNFESVWSYIKSCCELAARDDGVLKMTPILIYGEAGTGKSLAAKAISNFLNAGDLYFDFSSMQSNSEISGSSSFWSNSSPSLIFTKLTSNSYANFICIYEEIDKCNTNHYDPIAALHTLLEPHTSAQYIDACYKIPLNASRLMHLGTCNNIELVPGPILSRFKTFHIEITPEQSREIAISIAHSELESRPYLDIVFAPECFDILSTMSPRKAQQAVTEAIGRALGRDSDVIRACDFSASNEKIRARMGFLP